MSLPMLVKLRNLRALLPLPVSLRGRLVLLVLATLAPMIIFAVSMIVRLGNQERETFQRGAIERTRALVTAIDSRLESSIARLEALATSPSLTDDDLDVFRERAERVLKSQTDWVTIALSRPDGAQVMNALLAAGVPLPAQPLDRKSFDQVLRTTKPAVGHLAESPITKHFQFAVRVPVVRAGVIKYVLWAELNPQTMNELLEQQRLPRDWIGAVLDGNRRFVTRTVNREKSVGQLASDSLRSALEQAPEGWFRGTTVEQWDVYTPFNRSSFSGWTVALGIPADVVEATFRRSLIQIALFGGGLLALALFIAWALGTETISSIRSLAALVGQTGTGKAISQETRTSRRILEVEAVREAFLNADRLLREQSEDKDRIALRLELALTSGNIGVHEWHPLSGEIIWDDRVRAHWGLTPGTPVDYEIFRRGIHPDDRDQLKAELKRALQPESGGQYHAEFRVIGIEDHVERWIEARGRVVFDGAEAVRLTGTTFDISGRKAFQAELERQVQERTVKLEETIGELEAFSYSVSHDMRAPLRAMEGYAKALAEDYRAHLDTVGREWLDRISRSAHRLDDLIKDVLAYSRVAKAEIELTVVDLQRLIDDVVSANPEFQAPAAHIAVKKPLHRLRGHEAYLTQCVTNLLGNAVKFIGEGVVPEIHIWSEQLDGKVRVWFEDNGIGIDPAHHERIFHIFGQVYPEKKYGGTGIGLSIVRKAMQRMNGDIGLESHLGAGSRFWIILDAADFNKWA